MKNITVSVDEETYRQSRIRAAEAGTSVSALVRAYLVSLAKGHEAETEFQRLKRLERDTLAALRARKGVLRAADNLDRDRLHEPDEVR
jgi:plasmid stability protein